MMLLLSLLLTAGLQAQPAQRAAAVAGKAIVRGQVLDQDTAVPIPRAAVTLRLLGVGQMTWVRQTIADHEGRFEFRELPAGSFELSASAGEHRATHAQTMFGAMPSGGYRSLMLKDGEVRANVTLGLPRAFAISGRVTDEFGDPLAGVHVRVSRSGMRGSMTRMRRTDDRGLFRLFGLPAGRYSVCVDIQQNLPVRPPLRAKAERFVTTCHPSALSEAEAQAVVVTMADVDGIDVRVRRVRTFSVSGIVVDSTGAIAESAMLSFYAYRESGSTGTSGAQPSGHFEYTDLGPGDYGVEASIGGSPAGGGAVLERGYLPITIDADDVTGLVVTMRKPASVAGRIVFEDGPPQAVLSEPMTVECLQSARGNRRGLQAVRPARIDADYSFKLTGIFDPVRISVRGLPRGWVVKSVRYRGEDVTDTEVEVSTDPRHSIEVVATSRVAIVSGTVTDDLGKPASAAVFLFPAAVKVTADDFYRYRLSTSPDGRFQSQGVRAGDYVIIAVSREQADVMSRERRLPEALLKLAERVTLVENDRLAMNLRVVTLPEK